MSYVRETKVTPRMFKCDITWPDDGKCVDVFMTYSAKSVAWKQAQLAGWTERKNERGDKIHACSFCSKRIASRMSGGANMKHVSGSGIAMPRVGQK